MIEIIIVAILGLTLAGLMVTRITEKPIRIGLPLITESSANTFTTQPVTLPGVPSIAVTRGETKGIGVEVMDIFSSMAPIDPEAGQTNQLLASIIKGAAPTAGLGAANQRVIWARRHTFESVTGAAGEVLLQWEQTQHQDMTDHDGNGELVMDNEIHMTIEGVGNAGAKTWDGYMLVHLVEFDPNEIVFELLEMQT